ncbi:MAG: thymidylate kinase [bacterium]|nr:thymidylate kinase [bacterium]
MEGKLIVIEGLDGSGKATQTQKLYEYLLSQGEQAEKITFPDYDSPASAPVKMYLNGEFGKKPEDVNAYTASAFYAVDRAASYLKSWKSLYMSGKTILCDRYATSNIIYQMSKIPQGQWDDFISWQYDFEYNKLGLPAPEKVIYLDVAPEVSQKLMLKRYGGDESKKDLHESNLDFLLKCRKSALYASGKLGWKVIDCCEKGEMKSIDTVFGEILNALK